MLEKEEERWERDAHPVWALSVSSSWELVFGIYTILNIYMQTDPESLSFPPLLRKRTLISTGFSLFVLEEWNCAVSFEYHV